MVPKFFENLRDYQEIKLRILDKFLLPWSAKLGFWARRRNKLLWCVDGFAGEGRYKDGSDGSPLLGLRRARLIQNENRDYQLACFLVEKSRKRWRSLNQLVLPFQQDGIKVCNKHGEFSPLVSAIEKKTQGSPVLAFVDPFGISPLKYEQFRLLLSRRWPLDLILTFQHLAVHRLVKDWPYLVTEALGTNVWRNNWREISDPSLQTEMILQLFRDKVLNDGKFLDVFFYPIRPSRTAAPKYYLLFASRHYDAFKLWNDEISEEETNLSTKEFEKLAGQTSFLPEFDEDLRGINLLREIRELGDKHEKLTRQDIVLNLIRGRWGFYHTKEVIRAVNSLVAVGEITRVRGSGKDIDTDHLYFN